MRKAIIVAEEKFSLDDYKIRIERDGPGVRVLELEVRRQRKAEAARVAESALSDTTRFQYFSLVMAVVLLAAAGAVFHFISFIGFVAASGFAITVLVVMNAFHLRGIDKLSEESFLDLLKLALLKFFAPLLRKRN